MTAILKAMPMNHEDSREERYRDSQDGITLMRKELNKLTTAVGEIKDAIKGNDLGNEGLVNRVDALETLTNAMNARLSQMESLAKAREKAWRVVYAIAGVVGGTILKIIIDRLVPPKK